MKKTPSSKLGSDVGRCLDRQPRLTSAPRPQDGQQARSGEELLNLCQFCLPSDELGQLDREIVGDGIQRAQRRKRAWQLRVDKLEDVHLAGQVAQPVLAQVQKRGPLRKLRPHKGLGDIRHQDLAAMVAAISRAQRFSG